jgi:hypothetical protein
MSKDVNVRESKTWEITVDSKDKAGYIKQRTLYRVWKVGDTGGWKVHVIDSEEEGQRAIYLPAEVIDLFMKESVKNTLRDKE